MDPDAAYAELAEVIDQYKRAGSTTEAVQLCDEVVEKFDALDGWIAGGGFLPRVWA